jgi:8-oxo-dGTP pyrophosphatase MutT (NUDIX family)
MPNQQPIITDTRGRQFATSVAAVLAFIVNADEQFLLLSSPKRPGQWEVVNGALDAGETLLAAALREVGEEAGMAVRVRPLGVVHAYTYRYDDAVQYLISVAYLLAYEGGEVAAGYDMRGSQVGWFSVDQIERGEVNVIVPQRLGWVFRRALELYRLLKNQPAVELQPHFDETTRNKYWSAE